MTRREAIAGLAVGVAACGAGAVPASTVRSDLYSCEGCEALLERKAETLGPVAQIAPPGEAGEPLIVTGIVRSADEGTPVGGVIVYAHHTDASGLYSRGSLETEWSRRHGLLRGWAKTGPDGRYTFRTIKPAPYPDESLPAHIHLTIGEPGKRAYYVDDVVFAGEFGVTAEYRAKQELRGGSGIVALTRDATGAWVAQRDIRLERHPRQ